MGIVSAYLLQSGKITRYESGNGWEEPAVSAEYDGVACRFQRKQKQIKLADGTFSIATGELTLDGETDIQYGDTFAINGASYKVIGIDETVDLDGSIAMIKVYVS